ncbi:hypothetical protein J6590_010054 [Homalodisca vitripennis]|nr:hypothetical protein J6590_098929 [Homalodisca vitripennis]KAG8318178.1 hypothetical protein J6590_010054 [Homalodisca vitripennis]
MLCPLTTVLQQIRNSHDRIVQNKEARRAAVFHTSRSFCRNAQAQTRGMRKAREAGEGLSRCQSRAKRELSGASGSGRSGGEGGAESGDRRSEATDTTRCALSRTHIELELGCVSVRDSVHNLEQAQAEGRGQGWLVDYPTLAHARVKANPETSLIDNISLSDVNVCGFSLISGYGNMRHSPSSTLPSDRTRHSHDHLITLSLSLSHLFRPTQLVALRSTYTTLYV